MLRCNVIWSDYFCYFTFLLWDIFQLIMLSKAIWKYILIIYIYISVLWQPASSKELALQAYLITLNMWVYYSNMELCLRHIVEYTFCDKPKAYQQHFNQTKPNTTVLNQTTLNMWIYGDMGASDISWSTHFVTNQKLLAPTNHTLVLAAFNQTKPKIVIPAPFNKTKPNTSTSSI